MSYFPTDRPYEPKTSHSGFRHLPTPLTAVLAGEHAEAPASALHAIDREVAKAVSECEEAIMRLTAIVDGIRGETSGDVNYAITRLADSSALEACVKNAAVAATKVVTIARSIDGEY